LVFVVGSLTGALYVLHTKQHTLHTLHTLLLQQNAEWFDILVLCSGYPGILAIQMSVCGVGILRNLC